MTQNITSSIVSILSSKRMILGTGFIASDQGHVVTCAHLLSQAGVKPGAKVLLRFHSKNYEIYAKVISKYWRDPEREDVAVLQINGKLPEGVRAIKLGSSNSTIGHEIITFGYPNLGAIEGLFGEGKVIGTIFHGNTNKLEIISEQVTTGFSGSPVVDKSLNLAIGMIVEITRPDNFGRLNNIALAIASEVLIKICSELVIDKNTELGLSYEELLKIFTKQHNIEIDGLGAKYIKLLYTRRKNLDKIFEEFLKQITYAGTMNELIRAKNERLTGKASKSSKHRKAIELEKEKEIFNCLLFTGEAGIGKTNLLCYLAQKYEEDYPIVFFSGGRLLLSNSYSISNKISDDIFNLTYRKRFYDINELQRIAKQNGKYIIVFIDAINECIDLNLMRTHLGDILSYSEDKNIAFVISCRDIDWRFFEIDEKIIKRVYSTGATVSQTREGTLLGRFDDDEFREAWKLYKKYFRLKGSITKDIMDICRQPIMLRFFAEAYENEFVPSHDVRRIQIFNKYWDRKLSGTREKREAQEFLFKLASAMTAKQKVELLEQEVETITNQKADKPDTIFSKVLSENIIIFRDMHKITGENRIGFTYEAFFEYVIAMFFLKKFGVYSEDRLLNEFKNLVRNIPNYRNYVGAVEYIILLLEERNEDIYIHCLKIFCEYKEFREEAIALLDKLRNLGKVQIVLVILSQDERYTISENVYRLLMKNLNILSNLTQVQILKNLSIYGEFEFRGLVICYIINNFAKLPIEQRDLLIFFSKCDFIGTRDSLSVKLNEYFLSKNNMPDKNVSIPLDIIYRLALNLSLTKSEDVISKTICLTISIYHLLDDKQRKIIIDNFLKNEYIDLDRFDQLFFNLQKYMSPAEKREIIRFFVYHDDAHARRIAPHHIDYLMKSNIFKIEELLSMTSYLLNDSNDDVVISAKVHLKALENIIQYP